MTVYLSLTIESSMPYTVLTGCECKITFSRVFFPINYRLITVVDFVIRFRFPNKSRTSGEFVPHPRVHPIRPGVPRNLTRSPVD